MNRLLTLVLPACLGAVLLTTTGCEDKQCQDSLTACRTEVSNLQKAAEAHQVAMNELKSQLAQTQARLDEMTKAAQEPKDRTGAKAKEGKAAEQKKAEAGKTTASEDKAETKTKPKKAEAKTKEKE